MLRRLAMLAMLSTGGLVGMVGCESMKPATPIIETKVDCVNWKVITYSGRKDTPETVKQIIESNARRAAVCK